MYRSEDILNKIVDTAVDIFYTIDKALFPKNFNTVFSSLTSGIN